MQLLPRFTRKAKDRVLAAHPAVNQVVQVECRFCFLALFFDDLAFSRFGFEHFVEADEGGCDEEGVDYGLPAGFEEAGEGDDGLGGFDGGGFAVD